MKLIAGCLLCLLLLPVLASAQVYKCKGADGKTAYQQTPCASGQQETRPTIMRGPTLTEEERLNAMQRSSPSSTPVQQRSDSYMVPSQPQFDLQAQRQRERDCNARYDKILRDRGSSWSQRHGLEVERDRAACINGGGSTTSFMPDNSKQQRGMCQGNCASEQGICMGQCRGNGQCIAACAASHGRCTSTCTL